MANSINQNNLIDVIFNAADGSTAVGLIDQAEQLFPYMLGLSADDKKKLQGINVSNRVFVEDCIVLMEEDASILPHFISVQEVKNDYAVYEGLDPVLSRAQGLASKLASTQYIAGAEAYFKCLLYYNMLLLAARNGLPGAQEKFNRLKARFESQGPQPESNTDENGGPTSPDAN